MKNVSNMSKNTILCIVFEIALYFLEYLLQCEKDTKLIYIFKKSQKKNLKNDLIYTIFWYSLQCCFHAEFKFDNNSLNLKKNERKKKEKKRKENVDLSSAIDTNFNRVTFTHRIQKIFY